MTSPSLLRLNMLKYSLLTFFLILFMAFSRSAKADIITKCESLSGYSYFLEGGAIQKKDAGWQKDGISKGSYILIKESKGVYDIVFNDALNRTISSKEDGGQIVVVADTPSTKVILVNYPDMNIETYYFTLNPSGNGQLSVSQARYWEAAFANKHSLMRGVCSK